MKHSIILPAYNEETRIAPFLDSLIKFCKKNLSQFELIVVDDGSKDKTLDVLKKFGREIKIISYKPNHGKGYAVRKGMLAAKGDKIMFMDSDGAFPPSEVMKIFSSLDKYDIVVGTKRSKDSKWISTEKISRKIMSFFYNLLILILFREKIWDAGCGIKGFQKKPAHDLANNFISTGWTFDVELLVRANRKKYSILAVPVTILQTQGSKIKLFDPIKMALNVIKLKYLLDIKK